MVIATIMATIVAVKTASNVRAAITIAKNFGCRHKPSPPRLRECQPPPCYVVASLILPQIPLSQELLFPSIFRQKRKHENRPSASTKKRKQEKPSLSPTVLPTGTGNLSLRPNNIYKGVLQDVYSLFLGLDNSLKKEDYEWMRKKCLERNLEKSLGSCELN